MDFSIAHLLVDSFERVPLQDIMASKPFKFIVGPNHKEFFVHTRAFTAISPVLNVMMTGSMREAIEGVAKLETVSEEEFQYLCEFAYHGDYKVPEPKDVQPKLPNRPKGEAAIAYGIGTIVRPLHFLNGTSIGRAIHEWYGKHGNRFMLNLPIPPESFYHLSGKDCAEFLIRHAKAYVIADKYDVAGLRSLSHCYIFLVLVTYVDRWDSIPALAKLFTFIYENTREDDNLRDLVSSYVALKVETLFLHPDMKQLRDLSPDFCADVLKATVQRMVCELEGLKKENEELKSKNKELEKDVTNKRRKYDTDDDSSSSELGSEDDGDGDFF